MATVELIRADKVKMCAVHWVWKNWLALRKLHIFAGPSTAGKSTICLSVAAAVTTGGEMPDGTTALRGSVLMWSGEDDADDTLVPRFRAMGGDMTRMFFIDTVRDDDGHRRPFDPSLDMQSLRDAAKKVTDLRLVIIDPVVLVVQKGGDGHNNAGTRRSLQPVVELARSANCAVIGITHFSKNTQGREVLERINGSLAFHAAPRLAWAAVKSKSGERVMVNAKSNIGAGSHGGFTYDLEFNKVPGHHLLPVQSCITWGEYIDKDVDDILASYEERKEGALDQAKAFLTEYLTQEGAARRDQVRAAAEARAISVATLRRAKKELGVRSFHNDPKSREWWWKRPK